MNQFVSQRLELNRRLALAAMRPANDNAPSKSPADVVSRRIHFTPSELQRTIIAAIAERQSIGDPKRLADVAPVSANDNSIRRVRRSRKTVRGSLADGLGALLIYRNLPDSLPDPLASNWSIDPAGVIADTDFDEDGTPIIVSDIDRKLDIRPSIQKIMEEVRDGKVVRAAPQKVRKKLRAPAVGPIVSIGKLRFSDGSARERVTMRTEAGIETNSILTRHGAMLGSTEDVGGVRGGGASSSASLSNSRTTELFFGKDDDGAPRNWRPFITGRKFQGVRKDLTPAQSQALIDDFFACSPTIPPVTKCPPGIATGTARFADQFIGLVTGSTGKGGAPNWVDHFIAVRDRAELLSAADEAGADVVAVLDAAIHANSFADVGEAAGQSLEYARRKGGKRALIAANDNFAAVLKKISR